MDKIDLLSLVKKFKKLDNVVLYGYISSRLPRPINLFDSCKTENGGFFVKMDVLAVGLDRYSQYLKDFGITNDENNNIYLVNGSVALYVNQRGVFPDWYAVRGTLRLGSKSDDSYLTLFQFKKDGNDWSILFNALDNVELSNWNKNSRLYMSLNKSLENGFITVPDDVLKLPRFNCKVINNVITPVSNRNSLNSNINTALNNVKPVEVNISSSKNNFEIVNRDSILSKPDKLKNFEDMTKNVKVLRDKLIDSLKNDYSHEDSIDDSIKYMVNSLRRYLKSKPHEFASTGRALLKSYLDKYGEIANENYLGTTTSKYLIDDFNEVAEFILDDRNVVNVHGKAWTLCKKAFADREKFYIGIIGIILGIDVEKLFETQRFCSVIKLNFAKILITNPYLLLLISTSYSYQEVDYIAYCLGKLNDKSIEDYKLVCIVFNYLNNNQDSSSTTYRYKDVLSSNIGTSLTKAKYESCMKYGTYLRDNVIKNISTYINCALTKDDYIYPKIGWINNRYQYILPLMSKELELGISKAIEYGIVIKFTDKNVDWLTSSLLLKKEVSICEKMYELSSKGKVGYDHSLIDKYIDEYENKVGFKLEAKQREAVHLIDNYVAIVTGPAGSGKTTVSDCMVFVLSKFTKAKIEYAAPTGKAAKRLQEVVKQPVQTFNSKFKIFGGDTSLIEEDGFDVCEEGTVYFFDEVAMTNINVFSAVCEHLSDCQVFLLGDICQLPPIGKGLPFKNLLRFLPCVRLTVTKRSAENSGITYNSNIINEYSESSNWRDLRQADDFKLISCNDDDIKTVIVLLCKYYLGSITDVEKSNLLKYIRMNESELIKIPNITPDDIQVVSPVGKASYSWGTYQLNKELQRVFNPCNNYAKMFTTYNGSIIYSIGDRVIHTDSNMYNMQWYSSYKDGIFQKIYGFGISNGDVGKLVGFFPSTSCEFLDENESAPEGFKYPENLRDDTTFINDNHWFIVVEYYDFISDRKYYITYRVNDIQNDESQLKCFSGDDLNKLALFYAGTTHKMQGSQAKLIIGALGKMNFKGFLSRNMLYTEVTRASEGVYLIGSVSNDYNSQMSVARRYVADTNTDTVQELIFS